MPVWTKETFEKRKADQGSCAEEKENRACEDAGEELSKDTADTSGEGGSADA